MIFAQLTDLFTDFIEGCFTEMDLLTHELFKVKQQKKIEYDIDHGGMHIICYKCHHQKE